MPIQKKNVYGLIFIFAFTLFYYLWLFLFQDDSYLLTWGGNTLSLIGSAVPSIWLYQAYKTAEKPDKPFWFLITLGTFSYFLAECSWILYESVLRIEVPYPGIPDLFYILNVLFYLSAFGFKLYKEKTKLVLTRYIFDILFIMIVYATLSWYFLLNPIILAGDVSLLAVVVSLAYPIGDLALAFCLLMVIFSSKQLFSNDLILFFGAGLFTYIVADTAFVYLVTTETYDSGSWTDPLFILGVLLVGFTGLLQKNQSSIQLRKKAVIRTKPMLFAILFPFFGLTSLYLFMIFTTTGANAITIGVGLSILLVIVRQFLLLSENRRILQKYLKNADELQSSQERYRSLFEHHPDAAFSFTLDGTVLSVNEKGAEILGKTKEELIGHSLIDTIHADYQETVKGHFNNAKKGIFKNYELPLSNTDNEFYYLGVTHVPIKVDGEVIGVYAIARDITENKINQEQIKYMAFHDHLTHLANRIRFEEVLQKSIEDAKMHDKKFVLLFMDLNNFKDVNDDYGHAFGDKLLAQVARRIASMVKKDDCAARLGGDEFTVLIDDLDSYDDAMRWASQLLNKLNKPYLIDGEEIVCTPSVGFAYYPKDGECVQDLLNKADAAMYKNKRHSKAMLAAKRKIPHA